MVEEQQKELEEEDSSAVQDEVSIIVLRQRKAGIKSAFTKARHSLLVSLTDKELKTENIKDLCDMLDDCEREAMDVMFQLVERYKGQKYRKNFKKVSEEIEQLEIECSSAHKRAQDIIENRLGENLANQPAVIQKHSESQNILKVIGKLFRRSYYSQHHIIQC